MATLDNVHRRDGQLHVVQLHSRLRRTSRAAALRPRPRAMPAYLFSEAVPNPECYLTDVSTATGSPRSGKSASEIAGHVP